MTDLIYTRFVFIAQKKQNDIRYGTDMNICEKRLRRFTEN